MHDRLTIVTSFFSQETGEADPKLSNRLAKLISDGKSRNIPTATIDKALGNLVGFLRENFKMYL